MNNQRGEIGTVIAITAFVVVTVATAVASYITNSDETSLTTATRASESRGCQAFDAAGLPAQDGFEWAKLCNKSCQQNSDCPQSRDSAVYGPNSAWCYGFSDGGRCLQLQSIGDSTPVNEDTSSSCYVGKFCNVPQCGGENAANCSLCDGGWCNGGKCATCGSDRPVYDEPSSEGGDSSGGDSADQQSDDRANDESGSDSDAKDTADDKSGASCTVLRLPEPGEIQPECEALDGDSIIFNGSVWEPQCSKECSENAQCDADGRVGWCYGFAGGSKCAVYDGAADESCTIKDFSEAESDEDISRSTEEGELASEGDEVSSEIDGDSGGESGSFDDEIDSGSGGSFDDEYNYDEGGGSVYDQQEEQAVICSAYDVSTLIQRQACTDNNCVVCPGRTGCAASNDVCPESEPTDSTEICSLNITFSEVNSNKAVTGVSGTVIYGDEELAVDTEGSNNYFNNDTTFKVGGVFDISVVADGYQDYEDTITLIKRQGAVHCNARVALVPDESDTVGSGDDEGDARTDGDASSDAESCRLNVSVLDVRDEPINQVVVQVFDTNGDRIARENTNVSGNARFDDISFNKETEVRIKAAKWSHEMTDRRGGKIDYIDFTIEPKTKKCAPIVRMQQRERDYGAGASDDESEDKENNSEDEPDSDISERQPDNAGELNFVCKKESRRTGGGEEAVTQTCTEGFCNLNEEPATCREIDIDFVLRNQSEKRITVEHISVYERDNEQNAKFHRRNFSLYAEEDARSSEKVLDTIDRFCEDNYKKNPDITFVTAIKYKIAGEDTSKVITLGKKRCPLTKKKFIYNFK